MMTLAVPVQGLALGQVNVTVPGLALDELPAALPSALVNVQAKEKLGVPVDEDALSPVAVYLKPDPVQVVEVGPVMTAVGPASVNDELVKVNETAQPVEPLINVTVAVGLHLSGVRLKVTVSWPFSSLVDVPLTSPPATLTVNRPG